MVRVIDPLFVCKRQGGRERRRRDFVGTIVATTAPHGIGPAGDGWCLPGQMSWATLLWVLSALASSLTWCVQCGVQKGIGGEAAFSPQIGQRSWPIWGLEKCAKCKKFPNFKHYQDI